MKIKDIVEEGLLKGLLKGLGAEPSTDSWAAASALRKGNVLKSKLPAPIDTTTTIAPTAAPNPRASNEQPTDWSQYDRPAYQRRPPGSKTPPAATTSVPTSAVTMSVKTKTGLVVTKRKDGRWYDPYNRPITDPKLIQSYETSTQARTQRQTQAMAPGRSAAKTAALTPKTKSRAMQPSSTYSKPPQRKGPRRR